MHQLWAVATHRNSFLFEWEFAAKKHGWDCKLLGLGQPWTGFVQYQRWVLEALEQEHNPDEIIVVVDAYDTLVQRTPEEARDTYDRHAGRPIVVGAEDICSLNCDRDAAETCGWDAFPNTGFVAGPVWALKKLFRYGVEHGVDDDQVAFGRFAGAGNCGLVGVDTEGRFVANVRDQIEARDNKVVHNGKIPIVVHVPGQYSDLGVRSRRMREIILPELQTMPTFGYLSEAWQYNRRTFRDRCYFDWWWIPIGIAILAVVIAIVIVAMRIHRS